MLRFFGKKKIVLDFVFMLSVDLELPIRMSVVSPTVVLQTYLVSSQTCRSQFANVYNSIRKRYQHLCVEASSVQISDVNI